MTRLNSTVWRILALHGVAVAAVSIVLPLVIIRSLHVTAAGYEQRLLRDRVALIAHTLAPDGAGRLALPAGVVENVRGGGSFDFRVADRSGQTLIAGGAPPLAAVRPGRREAFFIDRGPGGAYATLVAPAQAGGRDVLIEVAQNLDFPDVVIDDVEQAFRSHVVGLITAVLLGLFALDLVVVRAALGPIRRASADAQKIDARRLDVRLSERGLPSETRPLVRAINKALERVERGVRLQREFTADVAHELRTPLAVMRFRVEAIKDDPAADALLADLESMTRVVDQLMALAELESGAVEAPGSADLNIVAERVVRHLAPVAIDRGREIALHQAAAAVIVKAQPAAVFQALRNLVENALNHSPLGASVDVRVESGGALHVIDCGPGVKESERELIFERFWRRDRRGAGGAGLGLAIVARIASVYGGSVDVAAAPGGGADFALRLPLVD